MEIGMAIRHIILNIGLILILTIILSTGKLTQNKTEPNYNVLNGTRLKPLHYDVEIKFDGNIFCGKCNIIIQINRPTKNITVIRSKIFIIVKIDLIDNNDNQTINIQKFSFIDKTYICFDFTQPSGDLLSPGTYILKMIYVSSILDDRDFFESFDIVKEKDKILNKIIRAGELFPYIDEPAFKSTFNISIKHHKKNTFLSNMPIQKKVEDMRNMLWTQFDTSPSMSVQHLTIVITTFTNFFASYRNVKIWYRKEMIDQLRFAENIVHGVVYYLAQKNSRKISKIDYVVTNDFQHSNIRTRGFVLLREEDIIFNNTVDDIARKIKVANLIARETISQWYDDVFLWSKEGFITFLAAHILDQTRLYYRMVDLFVVQTQQESLRFDTLFMPNFLSFRKYRYYIKTCIIWRMLYHILSDDVFWTSINTHINIQHNQTNATDTDNLSNIVSFSNTVESVLDAMNRTRNFNIENVVNMWLREGYHPILYVTRNYSTNLVSISYNYKDTIRRYKIYVKLTRKSLNFVTQHFWLSALSPHYYMLDEPDNNDFIVVNLQQVGYYRVNYNMDYWQKLADYLYFVNYTVIHVLTRAQIIDDAFYFLTHGQLNFTMFWNITSFLLKDTDYVAWYPMIKAVEYMTCIWSVQNTASIKNNIKEMFDKLLQKIGYDDKFDESDFTKCLREEAVKWACVLDVYKCRQTAAFQLEKHLESSTEDKLLKWKEWIYCKGLMAANIITWRKVWNVWNATSDNTILEYLTCSTNTNIIQFYLRLMRENKYENKFYISISKSRTSAIFSLIVAKHAKIDAVLNMIFDLFKFNIKKLIDQIAMIIVIITHEHDVKKLKKVSEFVQNNLAMSGKELIDAVQQKIQKRKLEYNRRSTTYGRL
ncbi:aminopeptidase N-like [Linepithema humile]|uniref:aminopeptidase N-like n=1 Tax=Linepithema humile TaxID=83485 RepID=UPI00351EB118